MRKNVVDAYARDMIAGSWRLNGETIKIATDGTLLDGQHRCQAVVAAETTVPMIVVRGLPAAVMATVDAGAKRTYADALKLQGEENTSVLAAVTRRAILWDRGFRVKTGSVYPTPLEMNAFLETHPSLRTSAEVATGLSSKSLLPASIVGLCHWLFSAIDSDAASWFLARVTDGDSLTADDPIALLRDRIVRLRVGGHRLNETEAVALTIVAWNVYRTGGTRSKLQLPKGGLTAKNYPEPR
ncbi:hypothetical protein D9V37_10515 [Nocardioides mangrovicus]|uniref:ParB/Sulfiredoxin domain-containing protein n=1 Tax=Nocardioides mangrovicus TaxID=2478913 RepID=A0A3L8P3G4_9ACTN|nr:hypothetical protein [Nocardioides mangrovicus]RLV49008.1 hypothetical protein D9V37_10515 [Nocardioides mangrovicus]